MAALLLAVSALMQQRVLASRNTMTAAAPTAAVTRTVTNLYAAGPGSFKEAFQQSQGGDTVIFAEGLNGTIDYGGPIIVDVNLTIRGPNVGSITFTGNHTHHIFFVPNPTTLNLANLTLANGYTNHELYGGSAIFLWYGQVNGNNLTIRDNQAVGNGGGILNYQGRLRLTNSTLYGNRATGPGRGNGAISTFSASTTLINCTVTKNLSSRGVFGPTAGGLNVFDGELVLRNTIVAGNAFSDGEPSDIVGGITSLGHNIFGTANGGAGFHATDLIGINPRLGSLGMHGGTTPTAPLLENSPARDAGDNAVLSAPDSLTTDQRGAPRQSFGTVDIGACEWRTPLIITNLNDSGSGSLRQAIQNGFWPEPHVFDPALTGVIAFTSGQLFVGSQFNLSGPGGGKIALSGENSYRLFEIASGVDVTISGLTLKAGHRNAEVLGDPLGYGGAIYNRGNLTLNDCVITNNKARTGGAIYSDAGLLTCNRVTVANNMGTDLSGGVHLQGGSASFSNSTITGNNGGLVGGGLTAQQSAASLTNCTISGNVGNGVYLTQASAQLTNCTITNNAGGAFGGGGIFNNNGTLNLLNTLVAGNTGVTQPDIRGGVSLVQGRNLIGNALGVTGLLASDLQNIDARLMPLAHNGGTTQTHALASDSPAINAGVNAGAPAGDQRGVARPVQGTVDIGAFETQAVFGAVALPNAPINVVYDQVLPVSGGTAPYLFSATSGSWPNGLNLTANGALSGTPTALGSTSVTVSITDSNGFVRFQTYTLRVICPLTITPTVLAAAWLGQSYSQALSANEGLPPYGFSLSSGSLPGGLTFTTAGLLSGTPTQLGTFNLTFQAADAFGCAGAANFVLTVSCPTITVTVPSVTKVAVSEPFNQSFTQTGGVGTIAYSLLAGVLPTGLTLATSGVLSGTPTQLGTFNLTIKATDVLGCTGTRSYALTVAPISLAIEPSAGNALGSVIAWGENAYGQRTVPAGLPSVTAIALGNLHTVVVKRDGSVVAWGDSAKGKTSVPVGLTGVTAVAAGRNHSVALKSNGSVVVWGDNSLGQANIPAGLTGVTAIAAGWNHTLALKSDGSLVAWGDNAKGQASIPAGLKNVVGIAAGNTHTVALKSDGSVIAWGDNAFGQTSIPTGLPSVKAIAATDRNTAALKNDGSVIVWGANYFGQNNVPAGLTDVQAIALGLYSVMALKNDGSIVQWGEYGQRFVPAGLTGATAIAAGFWHFMALTEAHAHFGNQPVGVTSPAQTFTIRNISPGLLTVSSVSVIGPQAADFIVNTSGMLNSFPASVSTTFTVSFKPGAVGARNATLRIVSNDTDEGTFDIALTGNGLNAPPTITASSLTRVAGSPAAVASIAQVSDSEQAANTLTATINNGANASINGVTVSGLTIDAAGLVTANVATACNASNASFILKVTDSTGASASATLNVTVTAAIPVSLVQQPVARTINANQSVSFSVTANGSNLSYQWRRNGIVLTNGWNVSGAIAATLTLNPALATDAGSYDVVVANACTTLTSSAASLTVNGTSAPVLFTELRFSGPGGASDWYVELYNQTDAPLSTNGLVLGFADATGQLAESVTLTPDRTIPAKGYFLITGPQYSLGMAAAADQSRPLFVALPSLGGVALFRNAAHPANRIDSAGAQGFAPGAAWQYFIEGNALPALTNTLLEHALVRKFSNTGLPIDTNNNAADFMLVAPTATSINGVTPQPGAPGPQNSTSPLVNNAGVPVALLNPANSANSAPNTFVENVAVTMGTATYPRSLYLRRTLTNNTSKPVTRLRFRITEISNGGVNTAILRALNASDITINGQTVSGLTLETIPAQPTGGGLNSTLSSGSITLAAPLAAGAKVNVQFRLGIVQGGSYRFYANIEAAH